jgi:hypothetical protein
MLVYIYLKKNYLLNISKFNILLLIMDIKFSLINKQNE